MTIRFKPDVKTWYYRFNRDRQTYFGGGFPTKRLAEDAESKRLRQVIEQELYPERIGQLTTFEEATKWFFDEYSRVRKRSWMNDRARIGVLQSFFSKKKLIEITIDDVESLRIYLKRKGLSDHTVNHYHALLKAIFNRLKKHRRFVGENPAEYVEMERVPKARVRFLFPDEERLLTDHFRQRPKLWPYYYVGLRTGMRLREICHMRVKDVDLVGGRIFVPNSKTSRSRYVPISHDLSRFLSELVRDKDMEEWALRGYTHFTVSHWFAKECDALGLKDVTFHVLRHTFVSVLLGRGVPIYVVSKIIGHSSSRVTEDHYGHLDFETLQKAVDQIDRHREQVALRLH